MLTSISATATVTGTPRVSEKDGALIMTVLSRRTYINSEGAEVEAMYLFLLSSSNKETVSRADTFKESMRISFTGCFSGDWYVRDPQKYPKSISANGPIVWADGDKFRTAFMVEVQDLIIVDDREDHNYKEQQDTVTVTLVGRLGKDGEGRYTPKGLYVASTTIPVSFSRPDGEGGFYTYTAWFRVSMFGPRAEKTNWKKGQSYMFQGTLNTGEGVPWPAIWDDRDGAKRASYDLTVFNQKCLEKMESRRDEAADSQARFAPMPDEDSIPF